MRRAVCALLTLAAVALVVLTFDSSCANPAQLCRGTSINRSFVPNTTQPERACTECVEATCCDLIGDCQGTACAQEVGDTHECVLDAGRGAAIAEPGCRNKLVSAQSKSVYQCMRDNCDDECKLPTCRLDPLVPTLGDPNCDRCFAQGCCSLMNACTKNRACLLSLRCIVDECHGDFGRELTDEQHPLAALRAEGACDGGSLPRDGGPGENCFTRCIAKHFVENDPESAEALCIAAEINECGASVNCGLRCAVDASADAESSPDGASDASSDAPDDATGDAADAGAD